MSNPTSPEQSPVFLSDILAKVHETTELQHALQTELREEYKLAPVSTRNISPSPERRNLLLRQKALSTRQSDLLAALKNLANSRLKLWSQQFPEDEPLPAFDDKQGFGCDIDCPREIDSDADVESFFQVGGKLILNIVHPLAEFEKLGERPDYKLHVPVRYLGANGEAELLADAKVLRGAKSKESK